MKNPKTYFGKVLASSLIFGLVLMFAISSCDADIEVEQTIEDINSETPVITSFSPTSVDVLGLIEVEGEFLQFVDKAFIGGTECIIYSRIGANKIVLQVTTDNPSGQITLQNELFLDDNSEEPVVFEATSAETLTVTFPDPEFSTATLPDETIVNQTVAIEGSNLSTVTSVTFGGVDATIEFQDNSAVVVSTPNIPKDIGEAGVDVVVNYITSAGEQSQTIANGYVIIVPLPEISSRPRIMHLDSEVLLSGSDLNLTTQVILSDGVAGDGVNDGAADVIATITEVEATSLKFVIPNTTPTGLYDISLVDADGNSNVIEDVGYINGGYYEYYDFDDDDVSTVRDAKNDPAQVVLSVDSDEANQPRFAGATVPFGTTHLKIDYPAATTSTLAYIYGYESNGFSTPEQAAESAAMNDADGRFGGNPVLHYWVRLDGDDSRTKIYLGTASAQRRESNGELIDDTGGEWVLVAVELNGFMDSAANFAQFHLRLTAGSGGDDIPRSARYDWIIVTDKVLTEFGAVNYTPSSLTDETFWKDQG
ncbi:IPT/TIG domain-containing protein [Aquimarina pacifica]|uniref:IPT/TIG domain-containing protein n=1 Tax=Aquimarina pacifica TaxID=1296415 RepID=UPI00046E7A6B|nr:IPT/TIG domain-containing protein [Aquimarina pacifica]